MTTARFRVARLDEIPPQGACLVLSNEATIALFKTHDQKVYALEDRCPHKGGPLSEGIVHGSCVTCPLHNMVILLDSGRAQPPDEGQVRTYPVEVENGEVFIALPCPPVGLDAPSST